MARATASRRTAPRRASARAVTRAQHGAEHDDVIGVYKRITQIVWQRLSPTFGMRTINAIARNVIARRASDRELGLLDVGPDGLVWARLEAHLRPGLADRLQTQLDAFLGDFFDALANLIGRLMVGKIFKEAEQLARKGEDE